MRIPPPGKTDQRFLCPPVRQRCVGPQDDQKIVFIQTSVLLIKDFCQQLRASLKRASPLPASQLLLQGPAEDQETLRTPKKGCIRIVTDGHLDRATRRVPRFLIEGEPVFYARGEFEASGDPKMYGHCISLALVEARSGDGQAHALNIIELYDIPEPLFNDEFVWSCLDLRINPLHIFLGTHGRINEAEREILERLAEEQAPKLRELQARPAASRLGLEIWDQYIEYGIQHEIAEALWRVLPRGLKTEWAGIMLSADNFLAAVERFKDDNICFTRYLRQAAFNEDFVMETFADKLGLYFFEEEPSGLSEFDIVLKGNERDFCEKVLSYFRRKKEQSGRIFS